MSRKYGNNPGMGDNHEINAAFRNAARDAGLNDRQIQELSRILHEEKEFECGDWDYQSIYELALEIKREEH